jgi:cobalamin-dependent methionine synthase I
MSEGFVYDAIASAMVENLTDLAEEMTVSGREHTGRFSPGYGDMPLEIQEELLSLLEGSRLLGITLTDSGLMSPSKSVTALIGLK